MSVTVWLSAKNEKMSVLDVYPWSIEDVLGYVRKHWNEEPNNRQVFVLVDDGDGHPSATVQRVGNDPEIALTVNAEGKIERHRCHYVLNAEGKYLRTEVIKLT